MIPCFVLPFWMARQSAGNRDLRPIIPLIVKANGGKLDSHESRVDMEGRANAGLGRLV